MDAALLRRFRDDLGELTGPEPGRVGIAVSGGPDSLALLLLAHRALGEVAAATVDHRLRPESAAEADHVATVCDRLGIAHQTLTVTRPITGNLQARAREARYALLEDWRERLGLDWIATAHHADDQLETMVMRLLRGSGIDGLAAIRPVNDRVIRPLLGFRRAELEAVVEASGFAAVDDPSNADPRFDRVRLRRALARLAGIDPARAARSADALREASDALAWSAEREWQERATSVGPATIRLDLTGLPDELARRLAARAVELVRSGRGAAGSWRTDKLPGVMERVQRDGRATIAGVLIEGGECWTFSPAPPRSADRKPEGG